MRTIYSNSARFLSVLLLAIPATFLAVLAGCGASNAPTTSASAGTIQLLVSSSQLPSAGGTTVDATAVVLSSTGQVVSGVAVTFSTNGDPSAYFSSVSAITDNNGSATAKLNVGENKSNRTINLSASVGTTTGTNTVAVTGTTVSISGNNSLAANATTGLTISVKDSAGNALSGMPVSLTSQSGNTIAFPGATATDSSGQVTANVTASSAATTDVITATAAGAVKTLNLTISNSNFAFSTPLAGALMPIGATTTPVTLHWDNGGTPVVGSTITFSTSRGTLSASTATTDAAGNATVNISSTSTGPCTITATGPAGNPAASVSSVFYTSSASSVTVQANPGTIAVTSSSGQIGNNSAVISVLVRDASNQLVPGASVTFSVADVIGGYLTASNATTDSNGTASVNYIAGTTSSASNGVTITATVDKIAGVSITPISGQVSLTVSGKALLVRLGTDNLIVDGKTLTPPAPTVYQKTFVAFVTDASGAAVVGQTVTFSMRPSPNGDAYAKGHWYKGVVAPSTALEWHQMVNEVCPNEDDGFGNTYPGLAYNGNNDENPASPGVFEDDNGDGTLWPSGDGSITSTGITNTFGFATATITYAKDRANWATYIIEARTGDLNSNDPPTKAIFYFPGLASDFTDLDVSPPGVHSPYGDVADCSDPQ